MNPKKKIQLNNILITILICCIFSLINLFIINKNNNPIEQNQEQSININVPEKEKININSATEEELKSLPNIDNKLAQEIINNRPYKSVYDLKIINGIGDTIISNLKELITCQ